ncbi:MAG: SDR family oxidoreductase [Opitutaceae bacterium]|jgi:NAD(P)-dependent dehydrogenase (short-subunit alcohol dehydrogenase family)|nr:SDR family oxidoreductase [Opitutaceae bacterium]
MNLFNLQNKIALVTGAGNGIGQRIAVGLAEAGASVACLDLPACAGIADTMARIEALGRRALALTGDITQKSDLAAAIGKIESDLGPLAIAVNCAGIASDAPAEDMPLEKWQRMIDINLTGIFLSCQAEARVMLPRKSGSIVNIASMSGIIVNRDIFQAHYTTAKAGVIHLTKSLAMEWASRGVRVNAISPGYTATAITRRPEVAELVRRFEAETPLGRMASVDELVGPAVFFSSAASSFCTGSNLVVDGGFVCW